MSDNDKIRIVIVGSCPNGKLILSSVAPHARVEYTQCEQEAFRLRPPFDIWTARSREIFRPRCVIIGYGIGTQTLAATLRPNTTLGAEFRRQCITGSAWMNFWHGGAENRELPTIEVPEGEFCRRVGSEDLLDYSIIFVRKIVHPHSIGKF
jgi:salicylate hydroxylase